MKRVRRYLKTGRRQLKFGATALHRWADRENRFFYAGLSLICVGCGYRLGWDVSAIIVGVILILAVNPIYGWWRDGRSD